jgi:RsmE family RNA methyltransferase
VNLILLFPEDFIQPDLARITGRRLRHVAGVHRAVAGDEMLVGLAGGNIGRGVISYADEHRIEFRVHLVDAPPPPVPVTLILALPRPKVLNRVIAGATSLGIKEIYLINAWRVEKSYWSSPRLHEDNLRLQQVLGLEQARDTILPRVETRRFFRRFVEEELPAIASGSRQLVAHPRAKEECPRGVGGKITLAIGPEGGFIEEEIESLETIGFEPVTLGPRILRVETVVAALVGRLALNG